MQKDYKKSFKTNMQNMVNFIFVVSEYSPPAEILKAIFKKTSNSKFNYKLLNGTRFYFLISPSDFLLNHQKSPICYLKYSLT